MKKLITAILLLSQLLLARDVIESSDGCSINWTQGYIECSAESAQGQSSYAAKLSAKVVARRDLLSVIKGVQLDSDTTVKDGLLVSDVIRERVVGVIKGCQISNVAYNHEHGYATATARIIMGKDLLAALMSDPTQLSFNEKVKKLFNAINPVSSLNASTYTPQERETIMKLLEDMRDIHNKSAVKHIKSILSDIDTTSYSGLLIDVSNLRNFKKAMVVRLVDKEGNEIYPARHLSREVLTKRNTSVGYMFGLEDARKNTRVFSTPLEIKVDSVYKNKRSNIVLNDSQIETIQNLGEEVLANAKIILVLED